MRPAEETLPQRPIRRVAGVTLIHIAFWVGVFAVVVVRNASTDVYEQERETAQRLAESVVLTTHLSVDYYRLAEVSGFPLWPTTFGDLVREVFRGSLNDANAVTNRLQRPIPDVSISLGTIDTPNTDSWLTINITVTESDRRECRLANLMADELILRGFPMALLSATGLTGSIVTCTPGTPINPRASGAIVVRIPKPGTEAFAPSSAFAVPAIQPFLSRHNAVLASNLDLGGHVPRDIGRIAYVNGIQVADISDVTQDLVDYLASLSASNPGVWHVNSVYANRWYGSGEAAIMSANYRERWLANIGAPSANGWLGFTLNDAHATVGNIIFNFGLAVSHCEFDDASVNTLIFNAPQNLSISLPPAMVAHTPDSRPWGPPVDAWTVVNDVQPYRYSVIHRAQVGAPTTPQIGFLAQDFGKDLHVVREQEDGYLSLDYYGLVPVLWTVARELDQRFTEQEADVAAMIERLNRLERVAQLLNQAEAL